MHKAKKIFLWILALTGSLLVLLVVGVATVAPRLINLETVRKTIEQKFTQEIGGRLEYRQVDLSFFPRPHVVVHQLTFSLPNQIAGKMQNLYIYPRVLPLFKGSFQLARLQANRPEYQITLSDSAPFPSAAVDSSRLTGILNKVHDIILSFPEFTMPGVDVQIKDGHLQLATADRRIFDFRDLQASYKRPFTTTEFFLRCTSNMWHTIAITGWLDTIHFISKGTVQLAQFQPQRLSGFFLPGVGVQLTDARANLNIDFETDGPQRLRANLHGSIPYLNFANEKNALSVKGSEFKASFQIDRNKATISLDDLRLSYPKLQISGRFYLDQDQPYCALDLAGKQIDVGEIRESALAISKGNAIVKDIFDIFRGGEVSQVTLNSRGQSIAELGHADKIIIEGKMNDGELFIPVAALDLKKVQGTAVISNGLLVGSDLKAQMGETLAENGRLKLGLNENLAPFHLEIMLQADLSQLPPVLERVVPDEDFSAELGRVEAFNGSAYGKLVLGIDSGKAAVTVTASKIHLNARYQRVPYPLKFDGGQFFFDGEHLTYEQFDASVGNSFFSQASVRLALTKTNHMEVHSGPAALDTNQVHAWLVSFKNLQPALEPIESSEGILNLDEISLNGPLLSPKNWQLQSHGKLENLTLNSKKLPRPLQISQGQFTCEGNQIGLENVAGKLGDTAFSELSAKIDWLKAVTLELSAGSVSISLNEIYPWLMTFAEFRETYRDFSANSGMIVLKDLKLAGLLNQPRNWRISANGEMHDIFIASKRFDEPLTVAEGKFIFSERNRSGILENCLMLGSLHLIWGESHTTLIGEVCFASDGMIVDMDITADAIEWARIQKIIDAGPAGTRRQRQTRGTLKIKVAQFAYQNYTFRPLMAKLTLEAEEVLVEIEKADLCSVTFGGLIKIGADQSVEYRLLPTARNEALDVSLACFSRQKAAATGSFKLEGEVVLRTGSAPNSASYSGNIDFSAEKGRIYRLGLLAKIFAVLNVTEIYRGEIPDLTGEGFAYNTIAATADFQGNKLVLNECTIDGVSMSIVSRGEIDLVEDRINLVILVAPFKTMDRIVKKLPVISSILGGKLVSIPFRAVGDIADYQVIPLPPAAVGSGILGIMERTLKLPITIIQPLFPEEKKAEKKGPLQKD